MQLVAQPKQSIIKHGYFSRSELAKLDPNRIPEHVSIVPDGNRRWAQTHGKSREEGHLKGADTLLEIVKAAKEIGIKTLTVYSFSTENWNRPQEEIDALMVIYASYLIENCEEMVSTGIRLETIGDLTPLPAFLQNTITETKQATASSDQITLVLAMNYGARDEMCRAVRAMIADYDRGVIKKENITENLISTYLDTHPWADPDLYIRTSGEQRVSNFLLWQISYAEIHISQVLWPDFKPAHLLEAVIDYQGRQRRRGGN